MIGQTIGNYRIVRLLGEGGMGSVYEALHEKIGRRAAIKVLRPELAHNAEVVARFINEARARRPRGSSSNAWGRRARRSGTWSPRASSANSTSRRTRS